MKSARILTILVVALVLVVCQVKVSEAVEPMGSAFTYQGHLYDANYAADGLYDFQFKLYDANSGGSQIGSDVNIADEDVIDALFTVELDFGSDVFDGNAVWLEIGVRPGDLNDPNVYTTLEPRQEVTPVPYALQTRGIFVNNAGNVGIGTTSPSEILDVNGNININSVYKISGSTVLSVAGTQNTLVGVGAGENNTTGWFNVAVGHSTLFSNTTGSTNVAMGNDALYSNTTGYSNSAMGFGALYSNTTGFYNLAVGDSALYSNTTGIINSAIGNSALYSNTTGVHNTAVGHWALEYNTTGSYNLALGLAALKNNTTGSYNSAAGYDALRDNTEGNSNTAVGFRAGYNNSTGHRNVFLGHKAGFNETGSDKLYIANSDTDPPLIYGEFDTGRVGIGTTNPQGALDVSSTAGAFIVPRMTTDQRDALTAVNGMIIYNTSTNEFNFYENGSWVTK